MENNIFELKKQIISQDDNVKNIAVKLLILSEVENISDEIDGDVTLDMIDNIEYSISNTWFNNNYLSNLYADIEQCIFNEVEYSKNKNEKNRIVHGVDFTGLERALQQFDENGIRGESEKWTVVRSDYGTQFEVHYDGYTVLDCVSNVLRGGYRPTPEWNETTEQALKDIVSATYGIKQVKTISSLEELKEHIEGLDWRVEDCSFGYDTDEVGWELFKYSPAGEDFSFAICHDNDLSEAIEEISSYAYNFDVDEHIDMWIEARNNNVGGVPDTRTLVDDAEALSKMLDDLADSCNALNIVKKEIDTEISVNEPDICD